MTDPLIRLLLLAAAVGAGLIGGLFFAFSTFVMRALDRLPAAQAIAAMQSINVTVLNPAFFSVFFGTAALAIVLAVLALAGAAGPSTVLLTAGAGAYLIGTIIVTIVCNVPLNNVLARVRIQDDEAPAEAWQQYRGPWTAWNHVRTVAALLAATMFAAALGTG